MSIHPVHLGDAEHDGVSCGIAPPASDVPAPRGTTLTPLSWQKRITAETSAVEVGSTTASGMRR
jgi:hypothetical protein